MNVELEALLKALQATFDARGEEETKRMKATYASALDEAAERLGVSSEFLNAAVWARHGKWLKAQEKTATLPPKA